MFVSSTALLCLYVFSMCCINIIMFMQQNGSSFWEAILKSPVSGILIGYTFTVQWFVGGLSAFHIYLIFTNQVRFSFFTSSEQEIFYPYIKTTKTQIQTPLNLSFLCRLLMKISETDMNEGGTPTTVDVQQILKKSFSLKNPVLKLISVHL